MIPYAEISLLERVLPPSKMLWVYGIYMNLLHIVQWIWLSYRPPIDRASIRCDFKPVTPEYPSILQLAAVRSRSGPETSNEYSLLTIITSLLGGCLGGLFGRGLISPDKLSFPRWRILAVLFHPGQQPLDGARCFVSCMDYLNHLVYRKICRKMADFPSSMMVAGWPLLSIAGVLGLALTIGFVAQALFSDL